LGKLASIWIGKIAAVGRAVETRMYHQIIGAIFEYAIPAATLLNLLYYHRRHLSIH
jgi:hypothetical protein